MSTKKYFKTKLVRDKVEIEYNSEDNKATVYVSGIITYRLVMNYEELDAWVELIRDLQTEVTTAASPDLSLEQQRKNALEAPKSDRKGEV